MSTVKVRLQSPLNITFDHLADTGIEREEWDEMTVEEQGQIIEEIVWEHVEAFVDEDVEDDEW